MVFFAACFFWGYLIQHFVSGKKAYLLAPIGAFLASLMGILVGAFIIAPTLSIAIFDGSQAVLTAVSQTFWGTFLVAFYIWYNRPQKEKGAEAAKKTEQL